MLIYRFDFSREDNDNQRESFRKPIWESDEEDGDIDDFR